MQATSENIQQIICQTVSKVVGVSIDDINPDFTFDELGLDSLSKIGIISSLNNEFKCEIELENAIEYDKPRTLAAHLSSVLELCR